MRDAGYFRSQAELCFALARQMSDPRAAESLRVMAADYADRAAALEGLSRHASSPAPSSKTDSSSSPPSEE